MLLNEKQEGIEISKDKSTSKEDGSSSKTKLPSMDLVVHPRFMHFMHMIWLIGRIDHVLRSMVKCWQFEKKTSGSIEDCQMFLQDNARDIQSLGIIFSHAVSHVSLSLEKLLPS